MSEALVSQEGSSEVPKEEPVMEAAGECFLEKLPAEVLRGVLGQLDKAGDLCAALLASRSMRSAAAAQTLWKERSLREFGLSPGDLWDGWSWSEFYQRVLFPFRYLLGWWHRNLKFFGGVCRVVVEPSGINCYAMECPLDDSFLSWDLPEPFPPILPPKGFPLDRLPPGHKASRVLAPGSAAPASQHLLVLPSSDWSLASRHRWRPRLLFSLTHVGRRLRLYCYQSDLGLADHIGHLSCASEGDDPDYSHAGALLRCGQCQAVSLRRGSAAAQASEGPASPSPRPAFSFSCHRGHQVDTVDYSLPLEHGVRVGLKEDFGPVLHHLCQTQTYEVRLLKFRALQEARNMETWNLEALRLAPAIPPSIRDSVFPGWEEGSVPKPGLYFGSYSCHGIEVIDFRFGRLASGRPVLEGRKITGDPNVPVNEMTIRALLDRPLVLASQHLASLAAINAKVTEAADGEGAEDVCSAAFRRQAFGVPPEINAQLSGYEPRACQGRFLGEGQIAGTDFFLPSFTDVVFELLGDGVFGVLWTHLRTHSLYFRANEQP